MKKLIFEKDSPSGAVMINLPEFGILRNLKYITSRTFHEDNVYEKFISKIEQDIENKDKILIIVNDNSNHGFKKRSYICLWSVEDLKINYLNFK